MISHDQKLRIRQNFARPTDRAAATSAAAPPGLAGAAAVLMV
jgi:hypothetical protein